MKKVGYGFADKCACARWKTVGCPRCKFCAGKLKAVHLLAARRAAYAAKQLAKDG